MHNSGSVTFRQCSRAAKRDGYCTQHHPDSSAAREAKMRARWAEQDRAHARRWEAERKVRLRAAHHVELVELLGRIMRRQTVQPDEIARQYERGRELLP